MPGAPGVFYDRERVRSTYFMNVHLNIVTDLKSCILKYDNFEILGPWGRGPGLGFGAPGVRLRQCTIKKLIFCEYTIIDYHLRKYFLKYGHYFENIKLGGPKIKGSGARGPGQHLGMSTQIFFLP